MRWLEHGVEVPAAVASARAAFTEEPVRWLPTVVGIHAPHEVETVSPLRILGPARFRIGDSWRNGEQVSRPLRVEFGHEPLRPALVLDGELTVEASAHGGTSVRFGGGAQGGRGARRAVGAALAGAAVRSVVAAIATRLQLAAAVTPAPDAEVPPCPTC